MADRTRNQQGELQELTAIEPKVLQRSLINDLSERDRAVECRNVRNDFNRLRNIADLQLRVLDKRSSHLHHEAREHLRAESRCTNFDAIRADRLGG